MTIQETLTVPSQGCEGRSHFRLLVGDGNGNLGHVEMHFPPWLEQEKVTQILRHQGVILRLSAIYLGVRVYSAQRIEAMAVEL